VRKVLIANRGEIAVRIARACRDAGLGSVAVYADSGADAVHPGYGFLAEDAEFAEAVLNAGLTWIGPSPAAIRLLGDKVSAPRLAQRAGVPLVAGTVAPVSAVGEITAFAREHGLPVAIKAASGGRGNGVTVARSVAEIPGCHAAAVSEDRGGGPGAVSVGRAGRAAARGLESDAARGRVRGRGDVRVPPRSGRLDLVP
jgi:acetyl-CoA/propionyl-CoA carboxylase biotin carboxyl carrier protein